MNMHKRIRLTPYDQNAIWDSYRLDGTKITHLAERYRVSRTTIYKILARARKQEIKPRNSANDRYRALKYGLKRLAKVESRLQASLRPNPGAITCLTPVS